MARWLALPALLALLAWPTATGGQMTEASCAGKPATITAEYPPVFGVTNINGTVGDDVIVGTDGKDNIGASEGDDLVCAGGGDDSVNGGDGEDTLYGGGETDSLYGGSDNDRLEGGVGDDDFLDGESGSDLVLGQEGDDALVFGGRDDDIVMGGAGSDFIDGNDGNDYLVDDGVPLENPDAGPRETGPVGTSPVRDKGDEVRGGSGDDRLLETGGNDVLRGGEDSDILFSTNAGRDLLDGGGTADGPEIVSYRLIEGGVIVNLCCGHPSGYARGSKKNLDTLTLFTVVEGSPGDDELRGYPSGNRNVLLGEGGRDLLVGGTKKDVLDAGPGKDRIRAGPGPDSVDGGKHSDRADCGAGKDDYQAVEDPVNCENEVTRPIGAPALWW